MPEGCKKTSFKQHMPSTRPLTGQLHRGIQGSDVSVAKLQLCDQGLLAKRCVGGLACGMKV